MKNFVFRLSLSLLIALLSFAKTDALDDPIAINGHSIKQLGILADPARPTVGVQTNSFKLFFTLKSKTGISKSRIRVLVNNTPLSISGDNIQLAEVNDNEENVDTYDVDILFENDITFQKTENEIKVQYLLSSITPASVQAQQSRSFSVREANNGGNGGGDNGGGNGGGGNGGGNGGALQAPRLISMFIEDINGDEMVSTEDRTWRLTIDHDQRLIDSISEENFNAATNPFLKNLKITKINPDDKTDTEDVTDTYQFDLEDESIGIESGINGQQLLRTTYTANVGAIKERQNLKFRINLTNFYAKSGVKLEPNLITVDQDSLKFTAQEIEIISPSIESPINFGLSSSSKKNLNYLSESVNLSGTFSFDGDITSNPSLVSFTGTTSKNKKTIPNIKGTKKINLKPSISETGTTITGTSTNGYLLTVPLQMTVSSTNSLLNKGSFFDSAVTKTTKIPFTITAKSSEDLDLILFGELSSSPELIFVSPISP